MNGSIRSFGRASAICGALAVVLAAAVAVAWAAPGAGARPIKTAAIADDAKAYTITIKDFEFSPRDLEISAGAKVVWVNKDEEPHKVAEVKNAFISEPLDTDGQFAHVFRTAGKFEYFCTLHPRMTGKIVVVAK
jgi:plastocyanin